MPDRATLLSPVLAAGDTTVRSLRHHRRRRRSDQDEDSDSSDGSSGDEYEGASGRAATCTTQRVLLVFLIVVAVAAVGFVGWLVRRGRSNSSWATSDSLPSFQEDCLAAHNDFRAIHNASALSWNATLADAAKEWAKNCQWKHSLGSLLPGSYGENLFASASDSYSANDNSPMNTTAGIWAWNNEESMYDYSKPTGFTQDTGHFSNSVPLFSFPLLLSAFPWAQTVWKGTTSVGCFFQMCKGIFQAGQFGVYLVCEYHPPGNMVSEDLSLFKENVQAPPSS